MSRTSPYIWAIGFDWNESQASDRVTMAMSFDNAALPYGKQGYAIDATRSNLLDIRLFDRTAWGPGQAPTADAYLFRSFRFSFVAAKDVADTQKARSPISTADLQTDLVRSYLSPSESTPCFPDDVPGHAWDFGSETIVHDGLFELTISFELSIDEKPYRWFRRDPEMVVTGVSG